MGKVNTFKFIKRIVRIIFPKRRIEKTKVSRTINMVNGRKIEPTDSRGYLKKLGFKGIVVTNSPGSAYMAGLPKFWIYSTDSGKPTFTSPDGKSSVVTKSDGTLSISSPKFNRKV